MDNKQRRLFSLREVGELSGGSRITSFHLHEVAVRFRALGTSASKAQVAAMFAEVFAMTDPATIEAIDKAA